MLVKKHNYTLISTALDWKRGNCDMLVKVYNDGLLTLWLKDKMIADFAISDTPSSNDGGMELGAMDSYILQKSRLPLSEGIVLSPKQKDK
eukprot:1808857-Ditylum_brightwellii.AAC.1